jgi:hypothetical protein
MRTKLLLTGIAALSVFASAAMAQFPRAGVIVLQDQLGGIIPLYKRLFEVLEATGNNIEIRGVCASACTLVLSYIPKERLCFTKKAWLGFHQYSQMVSGMITEETIKQSRADYDSYPQDIREWLEQKGGFEKMPHRAEYWKISAPELWKMGYRKCEEPRP